jgi:hypothetical protein
MAFKEDEISVSKGEVVQILYTNQHNMFLVHRPANATSPAAEGWVPGYVIGPRDGDGSLRLSRNIRVISFCDILSMSRDVLFKFGITEYSNNYNV